MFNSPYWEAAKFAFMIAGGAGVALGGIKVATTLATKGLGGFISGMALGGIPTGGRTEDTTTEDNTDNTAV